MRHTSSLVLLLFVLACAPMQNGGNAIALDGTRWTHAATPAITLQFTDGNAVGSGGCNQYRATYVASGTSLTFGPAAATKRACLEPEGNRRETEYFDALSRVASYTASEERLTLRDAAGATLVEFTRQP
jgi:putative lipoprotein